MPNLKKQLPELFLLYCLFMLQESRFVVPVGTRNALTYAKIGTLCFDLNAHGMLNNQPESYYTNLENGELKPDWLQMTNKDEDVLRRGVLPAIITGH